MYQEFADVDMFYLIAVKVDANRNTINTEVYCIEIEFS